MTDKVNWNGTKVPTRAEAYRRAGLWPFWLSIGAVVSAGCAITTGIVVVLLIALGGPRTELAGAITRSDLFDIMRVALITAAGIGGIVGLVITYRRQRVAEATYALGKEAQQFDQEIKEAARVREERVALESRQEESERLITSLYTSAVEQLGNDKAAVRMGALYSLERIGQTNPASRQAVVDVLCAYLRLPFKPREFRPGRVERRTEAELGPVIDETHMRYSVQRLLHRHLIPHGTDLSSRRLPPPSKE